MSEFIKPEISNDLNDHTNRKPLRFFFYGTLTNPAKLQEVLQLSELPALIPARVSSCKIMLWGQYPALIDGPSDSYVDGMMYVVKTEEHLRRLKYYETDAYDVREVKIEVDGKWLPGSTFMWCGDASELTEGTWSLDEWEKEVEEEMASHFRPVED